MHHPAVPTFLTEQINRLFLPPTATRAFNASVLNDASPSYHTLHTHFAWCVPATSIHPALLMRTRSRYRNLLILYARYLAVARSCITAGGSVRHAAEGPTKLGAFDPPYGFSGSLLLLFHAPLHISLASHHLHQFALVVTTALQLPNLMARRAQMMCLQRL